MRLLPIALLLLFAGCDTFGDSPRSIAGEWRLMDGSMHINGMTLAHAGSRITGSMRYMSEDYTVTGTASGDGYALLAESESGRMIAADIDWNAAPVIVGTFTHPAGTVLEGQHSGQLSGFHRWQPAN